MDKTLAFGDNDSHVFPLSSPVFIMEPVTVQPIEKANVHLRRKVIAGVVLATVAAIGGFVALQLYIERLKEISLSNPNLAIQQASQMLTFIAFVMGFSLIAGGVYTLGLARTVYTTQRYPPAGMATIRDTAVFTGKEAQQRGIISGLLSLLVILGGIFLPIFTLFLLRGLQAL